MNEKRDATLAIETAELGYDWGTFGSAPLKLRSGWTFKRRIADAACAFQTGHSVRDYDRVYQRRVVLLSRRIVNEKRREATQSPNTAEHILAYADMIEDALNRYDKGFESASLPFLQYLLFVQRSWSAFGEAEALGVEFSEGLLQSVRSHDEPNLVSPFKFDGKIYEGLFEDGSFDLFFNKHFFGRWNWHRFLRWSKVSLNFQCKRLCRRARHRLSAMTERAFALASKTLRRGQQ
ncbi:MAG: hypothetical protein K5905_27870 [Roseibium sp.]|uniref:hypothetical protein n=1 Tax=Roseibium sp. TaxID=1936156 RepID=UPI0026187829|nr:hypothetical protein [Roseibium sp.]MCV0429285.1 hypothetical protein [Roseibium sp.]